MSQRSHEYTPSLAPLRSLCTRAMGGGRLLCTALIFLGISSHLACDEEFPPQARLVLYHNLAQQGDLDILVNGDRLAYVAPGRFSSEVNVAPGLATLAIRSSGASQNLTELENFDFQLQGYFFVAYQENNEVKILAVDEAVPDREEGRHHVKVLNLLSDGSPLRCFVGQEELVGAAELPKREPSLFEAVSAGSASFGISSLETGAPIKQLEDLTFPEGGTSLFILYEGSDGKPEIKRFTIS